MIALRWDTRGSLSQRTSQARSYGEKLAMLTVSVGVHASGRERATYLTPRDMGSGNFERNLVALKERTKWIDVRYALQYSLC